MRQLSVLLVLIVTALVLSGTSAAQDGKIHRAHAIAMHGTPKYPASFTFDYANQNAPKGGKVVFSAYGSFNNLHPFILKGNPAAGIGYLFETLTVKSLDEPFTQYGLLAESISWPEDRSWVAYTLRPEARWHDGKPITVEDVIFSLNVLKSKAAHPRYREYFSDVLKAEKTGPRRVRFNFGNSVNRELPLIVGELPILPKHYWQNRDFESTTLEAPLGSGPYRVKAVKPGRSITYELDSNYWGKDLGVNRGKYNFKTIHYEFYRDREVEREALRSGRVDFFYENVALEWATGYNLPTVRKGVLKKRLLRDGNIQPFQGFIMNTRREMFKDRRVRAALAFAFDFEWANKAQFHGAYKRTKSYFPNSELAASGIPGGDELAILEPFRDRLPPEVFSKYEPPRTDGNGDIDQNVRTALRLLKSAGWEIRNGVMTHVETGLVMSFEIMTDSRETARIVLPFADTLNKRLGIRARVPRPLPPGVYRERLKRFEFDMLVEILQQSLSPGNEQRFFWGSRQANQKGSYNYAGIRNPVVDALVELVVSAPDRESLVLRTRALDRVLLWGHYAVPNWYLAAHRVLYWDKFRYPSIFPKYALDLDFWWIDPALEATLSKRRADARQSR